jgi:hypothetical protein
VDAAALAHLRSGMKLFGIGYVVAQTSMIVVTPVPLVYRWR